MAKERSFGSARMTLKNAEELRDALKSLPPKLSKKILRAALRAGAKPIAQAAKENAPVDWRSRGNGAGQLRDSIKVKSGKNRRKGQITMRVVAGDDAFRGDQFYGSFIEFGYWKKPAIQLPDGNFITLSAKMARARGWEKQWVPPRPFMRPAFDAHSANAVNIVSDRIAADITKHFKTEAK